jgi:O-antigen/teichoic acid export membrane protein
MVGAARRPADRGAPQARGGEAHVDVGGPAPEEARGTQAAEHAEPGGRAEPAEPAASRNTSGRAVAQNALSGYVTLALSALLGLVLTPILVSRLGTDGFGTWSLVLGSVAYLGLLEVGLGTATTIRVAALETDGPDAVSRVLSTSMALSCAAAGLGLLATVGLVFLFPVLFGVKDSLVHDAQVAVLLVGGWQCITFLVNVSSSGLLGTGHMHLVNFSGFVVASLVSVAQAAILLLGGGLPEIAAALLVGAVVTFAVLRLQVRRALPAVAIRLHQARRPLARELMSRGWRNGITSVAFTLAFGSDIVLVGLILSPAAAAAYAIALRAYLLLQRISTGVLGALGPTHAHAANNATDERRFELYCLSISLCLFLALLGALTVAVYAHPLLHLWLADVPAHTPQILVLLCAVLALQAPGFSAYLVLLNSEKSTEVMRVTVAAALVNIGASVALTVAFGVVGPALGSLVAVLIFDTIYLPRRVSLMLGQPYAELARRVFLPLRLPLALFGLVLLAGRAVAPTGAWVLVAAGLAGLTFAGAWWRTATAADLRRILRAERAKPAPAT